ncbi:MAG: hypothetical protein IPO92_13800 [Saprospiraceae bacterium]|nr:hypothetical protein [Saprospiraceae bacterium]
MNIINIKDLMIGLVFIFSQTWNTSRLVAQAQCKDFAIIVSYGLYIRQMVPDFKAGKFYSEFYWWTRFQNDSTITKIGNDEIMNLEYVNGFQNDVGKIKSEITNIIKQADHYYVYQGLHQGEFYFNTDFRSYPIDKQQLTISVESVNLLIDKLKIIPDTSSFLKSDKSKKFWGVSDELLDSKNFGFNIYKAEIKSDSGYYNSNFGDDFFPDKTNYGRITSTIFINRSFIPYISKLIIPLLIILFLVYLVYYIPPPKVEMASAITVTSLLSAIAFQLSISGNLPDIGYIMYVDKIFYCCYFLIAMTMALSLICFHIDKSGKPKQQVIAQNIHMIFRVIFPFMFLASLLIFYVK